jgi:hypothetical protein
LLEQIAVTCHHKLLQVAQQMTNTARRAINQDRLSFFKFSMSDKCCKAVSPATGTLAIWEKCVPSGIIPQTSAGTHIYWAKAPAFRRLSKDPVSQLKNIYIASCFFYNACKSAPKILFFGLNNPKANRANTGFPRRICQSAGLAEFATTFTRT